MALTDLTGIRSETAMRSPRVTIRRLLALVAATAVVLGFLAALQRRSERFQRLAAEYASAVHSVYFADVEGEDGMPLTDTAADYHGELAARYRAAADRPWLPLGSLPQPPDRIGAFWVAHEAVKRAYPGLVLGDYNVIVSEVDSGDRAVWAIQYRRRDNRSGLTVFLRDPIEIEVHSDGPPPGPSSPEGH